MVVTLERTRSGYQDKGVLWTPTAGANLSQAVKFRKLKSMLRLCHGTIPNSSPSRFFFNMFPSCASH